MAKENNVETTVSINLQPFLLPASIVLASLILTIGLIISSNNLKGIGLTVGTNNGTQTSTTDTDTSDTTTGVSLDKVRELFDGSYMTFGDPNSDILFVEFSDPSCPYCHIAAGKNPELNKQAGSQFTLVADGGTYVAPVEEMRKLAEAGKAGFTFVYTNGHGNGRLAVQALYCAYDNGKFWQVHDLLMSGAGYDLINETVKNDVANAGKLADFLATAMDRTTLLTCLESKKYEGRVTTENALASEYGVSGTPGFYVNDTLFPGAYGWDDLKANLGSI